MDRMVFMTIFVTAVPVPCHPSQDHQQDPKEYHFRQGLATDFTKQQWLIYMPVVVLCLLTSNKNHLFCLPVSNKSIIFAHVFIFSVLLHHGNNERNIPYPDS